jgi:hypothetical protein
MLVDPRNGVLASPLTRTPSPLTSSSLLDPMVTSSLVVSMPASVTLNRYLVSPNKSWQLLRLNFDFNSLFPVKLSLNIITARTARSTLQSCAPYTGFLWTSNTRNKPKTPSDPRVLICSASLLTVSFSFLRTSDVCWFRNKGIASPSSWSSSWI